MKTVGVLGGLGPQATMEFEALVHDVAQRLISQRVNAGYPPMLVYYFRGVPSPAFLSAAAEVSRIPILLGQPAADALIDPLPILAEATV